MAERDAEFERFVDSFLASTVKPKVERFLEEKRKEIVERYGTDKPHIDDVRKRRYPTKPSESSESADPIDLALELRDAIEAVGRRRLLLPFAMFHIGALFSYFELCLMDSKVRDLPPSVKDYFRKMAAVEDGRRPSEQREAKLNALLAPHEEKVRKEYEGGEREPHHTFTRMYLNVHPDLIEGIVEVNNPRTINSKKREVWTEKDKYDYASRIFKERIRPIAAEFGCRFGDKGVTIPKDD